MAGQKSKYLCELDLILLVIGRWTQLDTLNSICHLTDHVCMELVVVSFGRNFTIYINIIILSSAKTHKRIDVPVYVIYVEKSPEGHQM